MQDYFFNYYIRIIISTKPFDARYIKSDINYSNLFLCVIYF